MKIHPSVPAVVLFIVAPAAPALAGDPIQPTGIYFNAFSGPFSGTEWFQVMENPGGTYTMADIFGGGFTATITDGGDITLLSVSGSGSFSTPDDFVVMPVLGGTFTFDNNRAPFTTPDFPLQLESPVAADAALIGEYESLTEQINPQTGAVIVSFTETVDILAIGNVFRITDPAGLFFQGVFETPAHVVFRAITPNPTDPDFASFPGSAINFAQNMVGEAHIIDVNHFTATILLQSQEPLGSQDQLLFRFTAERIDPIGPEGDLDGDGDVDFSDLLMLLNVWGTDDEDADLDDSGEVGFADLLILLANWS